MTRRPPKRFVLPEMRRERADREERYARAVEVTEGCRRAIRRGMAVYAGAERDCPMRVCRRACVSDSFACLAQLRRPVLPQFSEDIAMDRLRQFVVEQARVERGEEVSAWAPEQWSEGGEAMRPQRSQPSSSAKAEDPVSQG